MQTKTESLIERTLDIASGFILSVLLYEFVILEVEWLWKNAILVTSLFTVVSFIRGYFWRRYFNFRALRRHNANS